MVAVAAAAPHPSVSLAATQPNPATSNVVTFDVSFDAAVSGLDAADFGVVGLDTLSLSHRHLTGAGQAWTLTIVVDRAATVSGCPPGYTTPVTAAVGSWVDAVTGCYRAIGTAGTWAAQNAACAPYSLATTLSLGELAAAALVRNPEKKYW